MADVTTPVPDGTLIGALIGGKLYGYNLLTDTVGADAMGLVGASGKLLDNLKGINDKLAGTLTVSGGGGSFGIAGSVAVTGSFWQATQPVSAASLPLPTGAATATGVTAVVTALGTPMQAGGSIGNTAFGISGTLPGFAATPTFNIGTTAGIATAANQVTLQTSIDRTTPADTVTAITPSDTVDLATVPKALLITASGTLSIKDSTGTTVALGSPPVGTVLPIRARRVMATGTSATVVGLS